MTRKIIILLILLLGIMIHSASGGIGSSKKGNFGKDNFSNDWNGNSKLRGIKPDNPGGGHGKPDGPPGQPSPISNGLVFLLIGNGIYSIRSICLENKKSFA